MPTILSVLFYIINYQPHLGNPNSKFSIFHHMQHKLTCLYNGNLSNQVPASKSILNQNVHRSVIRTASTEPKKEKKLTGPFKSLSFETSPSPMAKNFGYSNIFLNKKPVTFWCGSTLPCLSLEAWSSIRLYIFDSMLATASWLHHNNEWDNLSYQESMYCCFIGT